MVRLKAITIVLCLLLGSGICAYARLSEGLISAWTFDDGTPKDNVGNNDGKIHGGVEPVDGKFGKAMSFNGTDGYIEVPHDKSMEQENEFTVSAWIYVRQGRNHSAVVWKGEKVGWGPNFMWRICTTSNTGMTWGVSIAGTECWYATDNVITPKEWYFVCQVADGKQATAYVAKDGEKPRIPPSGQSNPRAAPAPYLTFPGKPIEMGVGRAVGGTVGNDAYLDAIIDEVYFWGRALSEDEVAQLAAGARPEGIISVEPSGKLATFWGFIKR